MNPEWLAKYKPYSDLLMEYGWFVAPFLVGYEFKSLEAVVERVKSSAPKTDDDKQRLESMIHKALSDTVFHPNYRARPIWVGLKLDHFKEYSHIYECGIFAYYKRNYIAAVLCLLPAMEGMLLSFCGWKLGSSERKPTYRNLIERVRTARLPYDDPALTIAHDMYRDTFAEFLDRWLYRKTSESDFSLSVLNRHLISHALEPGNFYRPADVHRLILAFDLLVDFLAVRQRVFYSFLPNPGTDPIFNKRSDYYYALAIGAVPAIESWKLERELLNDHPNYVAPDQEPNLAESILAAAQQLGELLRMADKLRAGASKPD